MNGINYPRHFAILGCMAALWLPLWLLFTSFVETERLRFLGVDTGLYVFALVGALHAISVVAALSGPVSLAKRAIFIAAAYVSCMAAILIGVVAAERLSHVAWGPGYPELALASAAGALMYGLLVKILLLRGLPLRALLLAAFLCPVATVITIKSEEYLPVLRDIDGFIFAWWVAFSTSLFLAQGRGMAANKRLQGTPASGHP
jgi:hypothetical protein